MEVYAPKESGLLPDSHKPSKKDKSSKDRSSKKRSKDKKERSRDSKDKRSKKDRERDSLRSSSKRDKDRERDREKAPSSSKHDDKDPKSSSSSKLKRRDSDRDKDKSPSSRIPRSDRDRDRDRERERDRDRGDRGRRRRRSRSRSFSADRERGGKYRSYSRSRSRSPSKPRRSKKRKVPSMWDVTPEMARVMGIEVNPWQPSPDNPYFSSAAAAAAAVTNPHNKDLGKNPVNANNMTAIAQRMQAQAQAAAAGLASRNSMLNSVVAQGGLAGITNKTAAVAFTNLLSNPLTAPILASAAAQHTGNPALLNAMKNQGLGALTNPLSALAAGAGNPNIGNVLGMGDLNTTANAISAGIPNVSPTNHVMASVAALAAGNDNDKGETTRAGADGADASGQTDGDGANRTDGAGKRQLDMDVDMKENADILSNMNSLSNSNIMAMLEGNTNDDPNQLNAAQQANFMHATRASKRIYVGNLPHNVTEEEIRIFFNNTMIAAKPENGNNNGEGNNGSTEGESVTNVYLNAQKRFAFVEFRSPQEATQAMDLEGIQFYGESLKIGRPANYNPNLLPEELRPDNVAKLNTSKLGIVSNFVPNGPNKLYCGGIPYSLTEDQVKELLSTYGQLRAFFLAKDQSTGLSKGYCFFQYEDASVTDSAIQGLNGIKIGDRQLAVRRHTPSSTTNPALNLGHGLNVAGLSMNALTGNSDIVDNPLNAMINDGGLDSILPQGLQSSNLNVNNSGGSNHDDEVEESNVLALLQMVTSDDLKDDEEYQEIVEDIRDECSKYGTVKSITIPRPNPDGNEVQGVGKVFVEFEAVEQAKMARESLQGRTFESRTVVAQFFDIKKYENKDFSA